MAKRSKYRKALNVAVQLAHGSSIVAPSCPEVDKRSAENPRAPQRGSWRSSEPGLGENLSLALLAETLILEFLNFATQLPAISSCAAATDGSRAAEQMNPTESRRMTTTQMYHH